MNMVRVEDLGMRQESDLHLCHPDSRYYYIGSGTGTFLVVLIQSDGKLPQYLLS